MDLKPYLWVYTISLKGCLKKLNKKYYDDKFKYLFKLPKNAKLIFFRHPKEFSRLELEYINPTHKIVIWGLLRKKYTNSKSAYKIRMGKINIPCIMILSFAIDSFIIPSALPIFSLYTIFSVVFVYFAMYHPMRYKHVDRNTRRFGFWKNGITNKISA